MGAPAVREKGSGASCVSVYTIVYSLVRFEWDAAKAARNLEGHGVDFRDAVRIFGGPTLERLDDRVDYGEDRWVALGLMDTTVLAVVYTERGDGYRIISARRATTYEEKAYFQAYPR
jgi:uncharacterized DUF497 family protein